VLAQLFESGLGKICRTLARQVMKLGFTQADQDRIADLAERNQNDALAPAVDDELAEFTRAGILMAILNLRQGLL
jgi:hypothetical protein